MSRVIRRHLLSLIDLLENANRILEKRFEDETVGEEAIVALLSNCQDSAVIIGDMIDGLHGGGTDTVGEIEEYCKILYPLALALNDRVARRKYLNQLKERILRLRTCLDREVPDKLEMVFFPYKASMWDSLESVYQAAAADPDCDAYVVPIPYYDKTPQQNFGEMHYEGAEFPPDIEITNWQTYKFEMRCPDVIYIHNPYDDSNLVTSVMPRFYARNLKKYTECLVYIPYFVLEEIEPGSQVKIESMRHFCFLPGVFHANKVIVQSEKMRSIYIGEYMKAAQKQGIKVDRYALEEKILGLGSPKMDKVTGTRREDCKVLEDWLSKIRRTDGGWKKVVLYNTSISPLLTCREKMLEKIKSVFELFREKQDEVALLWRPHPLIQTTIGSMHPELSKSYKAIVDTYIKEDWGIYDDTPDLGRAIAISDVYYGDASSLVWMYQTTGKPVMVQDAGMQGDDYFPFLLWGTYSQGYLWGTRLCETGLYRVDPATGEVDLFANFSEIYARVIPYKDRLVLIPREIKQRMAVFNITSRQTSYYDMRCSVSAGIDLKYSAYAEYEGFLFLFPAFETFIMIINMENMLIEYMEEPVKEYMALHEGRGFIFAPVVCHGQRTVVIPCYMENMALIMDLETRGYHWEEIPLDTEKRGICAAARNGKSFFLATQDGGIFLWNRDRRSTQLKFKNNHVYASILYDKETLWLFPDDMSPILNYCISDNSITVYDYDETFRFKPFLKTFFRNVIAVGDKAYVGIKCANELMEVDIIQKNIKYIKFHPAEIMFSRYAQISKRILHEDEVGSIDMCLEGLLECSNEQKDKRESTCYGGMIYEIIKKGEGNADERK